MRRVTYPLTNYEAIIELLLQPPTALIEVLKAQGKKVPAPKQIRALLDTGFTGGLAIEQSLTKDWPLKIRNFNRIAVPREDAGRFYDSFVWEADVAVKIINASAAGKNILLDPIPATLMEFVDSGNIQALIGQEILQAASFHYDGPKGIFSIAFSSQYEVL
jgi:predicted aspartyl protease